jgi:hypothetical protein
LLSRAKRKKRRPWRTVLAVFTAVSAFIWWQYPLRFHLNFGEPEDLQPTSVTFGTHKYVWTESDNPQIGWHWVKLN